MGAPSVFTGTDGNDRDKLEAALKVCVTTNLALYNTKYLGGWSVQQFDDTQWPGIYRCMKALGYQPNGPDYTQQSNFGSR